MRIQWVSASYALIPIQIPVVEATYSNLYLRLKTEHQAFDTNIHTNRLLAIFDGPLAQRHGSSHVLVDRSSRVFRWREGIGSASVVSKPRIIPSTRTTIRSTILRKSRTGRIHRTEQFVFFDESKIRTVLNFWIH